MQSFVNDVLEDNTDEGILNDEGKVAEIITLLEQKGCRKKVDAETGETLPQGASDVIDKIKRTAELIAQEDEDGPKSKKIKTEISETDRAKAEILSMFSSKKVDELKDVLRWNKQIVGGNKDTLLARIIDAKLNGRLGRCPSCLRGRIKLTEEDGGGEYDRALMPYYNTHGIDSIRYHSLCFLVVFFSCVSSFRFPIRTLPFALQPFSHCFLQRLFR